MPMTFDNEDVDQFLRAIKCDITGTPGEKRERAAKKSEEMGDHLQAWEIRTGRPWNMMTREEALELANQKPLLKSNPGLISRLL
jgi:hypothetical protein